MSTLKKTNTKVIAIVGPTSSGKTAWAKKLAIKFSQAKIISADSRQIYLGMDIGTGKDKNLPQDLIDIIEPTKKFTLHDWQKMASNLLNQYFKMKNLPIIVGGTGLYIDALLYGYVIPDLKKESIALRKKLEKLPESELIKKLKEIDPESSLKIDPKNKRRLIRALEVSILTRRPWSKLQKKQKPKFETLIIGIDTNRETLYSKIDARIDQMIKNGLVEEVRDLTKKYQFDLPTFNTIGYKEIIDYLQGRQTLKVAVQKIKYNTHGYVRRQETWFRKNKDIKWVEKYEDAEKLIKKFLKAKSKR